jgi:S1-C subfamily serine protease
MDVITTVDGRQVTDASTLYEDLAQQRPGSTDVLVIARGNQTVTVTVTLSSASPAGG